MIPKVSIIVPIYNVELYLTKCLDSILNQTYKNFELILIDDGSTDNSGKICNDFKGIDKRIKLIQQENKGVGIARNNGLALAKGKYIYFCDPDDYITETLLEDNIKYAEENDANLVIFGNYEKVNDKLIPITYDEKYIESTTSFREEFEYLFSNHNMFVLWNKLYTREYIEKIGAEFPTNKVGEDTLFNYYIYRDLDRVMINHNIYYFHVVRMGTALTKYQDERFEMRYMETEELDNMVKYWGYEDKYQNLISNDWIKTLYIGINNLFHKDCPLSNSMKKSKIKTMINTPKINKVLKEKSISEIIGSIKKIEFLLIKIKSVSFLFHFILLKNFIKDNRN